MLIQVLGPVALVHGGRSATVARAQARAVLALLALAAGQAVPHERIAAALWGGDGPPAARSQVYGAVSAIRRLLTGTGATVDSGRFGYRLMVGPEDVDALRFERELRLARSEPVSAARRLRDALALWHGDALADATGSFVEGTRARLGELRLAAVDELALLDIAGGRYGDAAAGLAPVVAEHPTHERLRGRLMVALVRDGRKADALRLYHEHRAWLAEHEGLDPGPELAALAESILLDRDLGEPVRPRPATPGHPKPGVPERPAPERPTPERPATAADRAAGPPAGPAGWPAADPLADPVAGPPNLLPPGIPDFVGRGAETSRAAVALRPGLDAPAPVVLAVTGLGGIGKTTLAVRIAWRAAPDFADGCLFADLRGSGDRPADPHAVTGQFLRALGVAADRVPVEPGERADLYRTVTARRRLLVVLDNARDEAQVRPLIPTGAGCAVILTARAALAGLDGARPMPLSELDLDEGTALIATIAGVRPGDGRRLAAMCGGLPLALRITGARLARDGHVAAMGACLADERARLDTLSVGDRDVRGTFALSYDRLSPAAATLLHRIAALPVTEVSEWVAACLLDTGPAAAAGRAAELSDVALLTARPTDHGLRLRLHDLVQLYARERGNGTAEVAAPLRRAYEAVAGLLVAVDRRLHSGFPTPVADPTWYRADPGGATDRPTEWFAAERDLVFAAVADAHERGWRVLAAQILLAATNLVGMCDQPDDWDRLTAIVLPGLRTAGAPAQEAGLLLASGGALRLRGDLAGALPRLRRARILFGTLDDATGAATAATQLAIIHRRAGRTGLAERVFGWAIDRFARAGHPPQEVQAHLGLGNVYYATGRLPAARAAYRRALDLTRAHGEEAAQLYPNVLGCLAAVLAAEGRDGEALAQYTEAVTRAAAIGDRAQWAALQMQVALMHRRGGRADPAAAAARVAAEAFDRLGMSGPAEKARAILDEAVTGRE